MEVICKKTRQSQGAPSGNERNFCQPPQIYHHFLRTLHFSASRVMCVRLPNFGKLHVQHIHRERDTRRRLCKHMGKLASLCWHRCKGWRPIKLKDMPSQVRRRCDVCARAGNVPLPPSCDGEEPCLGFIRPPASIKRRILRRSLASWPPAPPALSLESRSSVSYVARL